MVQMYQMWPNVMLQNEIWDLNMGSYRHLYKRLRKRISNSICFCDLDLNRDFNTRPSALQHLQYLKQQNKITHYFVQV